MRPVFLSGFMGTGKSTVGPRLAARLGVRFVDTDLEIERASGKSVPELWREEGERGFRRREAALVERLVGDGAPVVVALGGGAVTVERTRRLLVDRGIVVTLVASPETVVSRIADVAGRPNLAVGGDPVERARELLVARAEAYAEAHARLDTGAGSVEATVEAAAAVVARDPLLVPLGGRSYCVDVCATDPSRVREAVARQNPSSLVVVTDENVHRARGAALEAGFAPLGLRTTRVTLAAGEQHKTIDSVRAIWDAALTAGVDREALVVACGGGVVGDLAGFAAASLLRGLRFIQVPTTLLSMVDASVGGKTGFDHAAGKNLIGAFHQPSAVIADLAHLETLPDRERLAGLAEVVKVALVADASLLDDLERRAAAVRAGEREALAGVVRAAIRAKIGVVRDDERESGARALLNLGHTVGHALESHGGYARWLHGEAVALGIVVEMRAMVRLGWTAPALLARTRALLDALGLPTNVSADDVLASWPFVSADKKRQKDSVRLAVVEAPGRSDVRRIALADLKTAVLAG